MENKQIKVPTWFWVVAVFFLLWNIMGVFSFLMHTFITDEALALLSENERALYAEYPLWTDIVFAIAVFSGLIASIGLFLKKKWAKLIAIISLGAVIPQMLHNVFFTSAIEVYGPVQAATMPVLVLLFGIVLVWFAHFAIQKGWLK